MTYKVLLVDDESIIRETIKNRIQWNALGFEVIGSLENGQEAVEFLKEQQPDLILTDIYMPFMDGLELTRYVYENYPEIKTIIISGYDDFKYAKEAVKYKVEDYILKPVTSKELTEILEKVKKSLDESQKAKEDFKKIRGAYISQLPMVRGRFLSHLVTGNIPVEEIDAQLSEYDIVFKEPFYMVLRVQFPNPEEWLFAHPDFGRGLLAFTIFNICEEITRKYNGITFQDNDNETVIILGGSGKESLEKSGESLGESLIRTLRDLLGISIVVGSGSLSMGVDKLTTSFKEATIALGYSFTLGKERYIHYDRYKNFEKFSRIAYMEIVERIEVLLNTGRQVDIGEEIRQLVDLLGKSFKSKDEIAIYIHNFTTSIIQGIEIAKEEAQSFQRIQTGIEKADSIQMLEICLVEFCYLVQGILSKESGSGDRMMELAREYMLKHYEDKELSVNDVAKYMNMSTSYFSASIKNHTGFTFVELLTKIRMDKAKDLLLHDNWKTYEVADKVGYSDPHYFSSVFKKQTGYTPREYIKQNENI